MKTVLSTALTKLSERSSVLGLLGLASVALGYTSAPEHLDAIASTVSAVAGIALVWLKEAE
jgi:hypothetical protein